MDYWLPFQTKCLPGLVLYSKLRVSFNDNARMGEVFVTISVRNLLITSFTISIPAPEQVKRKGVAGCKGYLFSTGYMGR